jgi:Zn-dependent M28 family amino/carboxypeptidase
MRASRAAGCAVVFHIALGIAPTALVAQDQGVTAAAHITSGAIDRVVVTLLDLQPGQEAFYYRSDHYSFARRGVPALFFSTGIHADYHQVSDEVERVDADKAARIGRLLLHLGRDLADADTRPHWEPASFARIVGPPE